MIKRCVYTVITNNYDELNEIKFKSNLKFICFTDNLDLSSKGWEIKHYDFGDLSFADANRKIKILVHLFLSDFDESLYIDGNISLKADPEPLFDKYLKNNFLVIPKHVFTNCIFKEAANWKFTNKLDIEKSDLLDKQMGKYLEAGMPKNFGLWENNIILRKNNHPKNIIISNIWWKEYMNGIKRDQLSLSYILWLKNIKIGDFLETPRLNNKYFDYELHNINKSKNIILLIKRVSNIRQKQSFFYAICSFIFRIIEKIYKLFLTVKNLLFK